MADKYVEQYSNITSDIVKLSIGMDDDNMDTLIDIYLAAAKNMADEYIDSPLFAPAESGDSIKIPAIVESWVLMTTVRLFEQRMNGLDRLDIKDTESAYYGKIDYTPLDAFRGFFAIGAPSPASLLVVTADVNDILRGS